MVLASAGYTTPSNMQSASMDGSPWTVFDAATLAKKMQLKLATSPCYSMNNVPTSPKALDSALCDCKEVEQMVYHALQDC